MVATINTGQREQYSGRATQVVHPSRDPTDRGCIQICRVPCLPHDVTAPYGYFCYLNRVAYGKKRCSAIQPKSCTIRCKPVLFSTTRCISLSVRVQLRKRGESHSVRAPLRLREGQLLENIGIYDSIPSRYHRSKIEVPPLHPKASFSIENALSKSTLFFDLRQRPQWHSFQLKHGW